MIAGDILPDQGDPSALSKLILGFRQAKQQEAATDLDMRFQQARMQQFEQLAPLIRQEREQGLQLGEQQFKMNQQQIERAAEELAEIRRQSGVLPRLTNAMTKTLGLAKSFADVNKVMQETQLAAQKAADTRIQQAEDNRRKFYQALADPNTGEVMVSFVSNNPSVAEGYGIRPEEVPQFIQQAEAFHAQRKQQAEQLARVQSYEANLIRALQTAVSNGDKQRVIAAARELARLRIPMQNFEDPNAYENRIESAVHNILMAFGYQGQISPAQQQPSDPAAPVGRRPPPPTVAPQVEAMRAQQGGQAVVPSPFPEGTIAFNKQTGQKIVRRGGRWVPYEDQMTTNPSSDGGR